MKKRILDIYEKIDKTLILYMYILSIISTLFIYSATRNVNYVYKNLIWVLIATIAYFILLLINYTILTKYIYYLYGISILILIYTKFLGIKKLGASRWISILGFQFQPSEFIKIVFCITLAYHFVKNLNKRANNILEIIYGILPGIPILALIFIQPDLGTTLILTFSYGCLLYLSNSNIKPLILIFILILCSIYPVYKYGLKDYQRTRIETFLNPEKDLKGDGWHITQSKISIGSGKITGKGILQGSQSRLKFLPEPQTDFIFSVIAEEIGFVGSFVVLGIYFLLILNLLSITEKIENTFGRYIIYGIIGIFIAHIIINVGMTIGLFPVTGKPLLLLSYGGTSMLATYIMLALVQNIKVYDTKW